MKYIALLRRLVAKPAPAPVAPTAPVATIVVYRGETVLSQGCGR